MSRRNLTVLSLGKNILYNISKSITILSYKKSKVSRIKNNKKVFLSPKSVDYVKYIHKRNYPAKCAVKKSFNRHKYDDKIEELVNEQINSEFTAGYIYLTFAVYYARSNVAFPGFYGYFKKMYFEEQQHGLDFVKYQILRGGIVKLQPICPIKETEFPDIPKTFEQALNLEKEVKEKLQHLYDIASVVNDTNVQDFLDPFIAGQEDSICELARLFTRACRISSTDEGIYLFDRELHCIYGESGEESYIVRQIVDANHTYKNILYIYICWIFMYLYFNI